MVLYVLTSKELVLKIPASDYAHGAVGSVLFIYMIKSWLSYSYITSYQMAGVI
jgi:hypothetical protein